MGSHLQIVGHRYTGCPQNTLQRFNLNFKPLENFFYCWGHPVWTCKRGRVMLYCSTSHSYLLKIDDICSPLQPILVKYLPRNMRPEILRRHNWTFWCRDDSDQQCRHVLWYHESGTWCLQCRCHSPWWSRPPQPHWVPWVQYSDSARLVQVLGRWGSEKLKCVEETVS